MLGDGWFFSMFAASTVFMHREAEPVRYGTMETLLDSKPGSNFAFANRLMSVRLWIGIQNRNPGLLAILGGTDDGRVTWQPEVLQKARATGLKLDEHGNVVR